MVTLILDIAMCFCYVPFQRNEENLHSGISLNAFLVLVFFQMSPLNRDIHDLTKLCINSMD